MPTAVSARQVIAGASVRMPAFAHGYWRRINILNSVPGRLTAIALTSPLKRCPIEVVRGAADASVRPLPTRPYGLHFVPCPILEGAPLVFR